MSEKEVSKKTLGSMDEAAKNLEEGKVSEPIDEKLDKYTKGEETDKSEKEEVSEESGDIEDLARAGHKEVAKNADVMAIEKDKADASDEEGEKLPSFFVEEEDKHIVEVDILASKSDGKIVSISRKGLDIDFSEFGHLNHSLETFEFSIPTYDAMSTYRQRSAIFSNESNQMVVDRVQLRNFFLVWHLRDWSLRDRDGNKVELNHDEDGSLDDGSMKRVYSVQPTLIDVIMTLFEKDMLLT